MPITDARCMTSAEPLLTSQISYGCSLLFSHGCCDYSVLYRPLPNTSVLQLNAHDGMTIAAEGIWRVEKL